MRVCVFVCVFHMANDGHESTTRTIYIFFLFIRLFIDIELFNYLSDSVLVYLSTVTQSGAKCNGACSTC